MILKDKIVPTPGSTLAGLQAELIFRVNELQEANEVLMRRQNLVEARLTQLEDVVSMLVDQLIRYRGIYDTYLRQEGERSVQYGYTLFGNERIQVRFGNNNRWELTHGTRFTTDNGE